MSLLANWVAELERFAPMTDGLDRGARDAVGAERVVARWRVESIGAIRRTLAAIVANNVGAFLYDHVFDSRLGPLIVVSAATGILTLHRTPATSRVRSLRAAPAVLVLLACFTWINGYRASVDAIATWERQGGTGQIAPGLWIAGIGILLNVATNRRSYIVVSAGRRRGGTSVR